MRREPRCQQRHPDQAAAGQAGDLGVKAHHLGVGDDVRATDLIDAAYVPGPSNRLDQQVNDVGDGDRLAPGFDPARRHHDRQHLDEVTEHLEAGRAGADNDPGPQLDDLDPRRCQQPADIVPALQVLAEHILVPAQTSEVDDATHTRLRRGPGEVLSVALLSEGPPIALADRVDEVDSDVHAFHGLGHVAADVTPGHLDGGSPWRRVQLRRGPGQAAHLRVALDKRRHKTATDIPGGTGNKHSEAAQKTTFGARTISHDPTEDDAG